MVVRHGKTGRGISRPAAAPFATVDRCQLIQVDDAVCGAVHGPIDALGGQSSSIITVDM